MRISSLFSLVVAAGIGATLALPMDSRAADPLKPGRIDGTVVLTSHAIAVGVGYEWGSGVLRFHGHRYPFIVKGLSIADVGMAKVQARGRVYGLHNLADFSGTYAAVTGEATVGQGEGGQFLKNGNGVELRLDQSTKGARLTGSGGGVDITLRQ